MTVQSNTPEITQDDKLWAMLSNAPIIGWIVALIVLLTDEKKNRPFMKYHAVQSLAIYVIVLVTSIVGVGVCIAAVIWIYQIYLMVKANQGEWVKIPALTDFLKKQGWVA